MSEIYEPAEDSYLMSSVLSKKIQMLLRKNPKIKFLEIGCGSGINLQTAEKVGVNKENILGADVNNKAVSYCKDLGFNSIVSNLFSNIKGKFDVIVFNPPYLPLDKREPKSSRLETTGGKKGNEIILRFLGEARNHLDINGRIFLITSSLAEDVDFETLGYVAKVIVEKKLFFEKLACWELSLNNK